MPADDRSSAEQPADPAASAGSGEPLRSRDEEAIGWGDERGDGSEDPDVARLLADRPPHHDRD